MEGLARLFVGIGFLWVTIVLVWGLAAGIDQPYEWYRWAVETSGWGWMPFVYLGLGLFVVPMGMLVFLKDIFGDPVAAWVKWGAPGAFVTIYAFFLLIALPHVGGPLFGGLEGIVAPMATPPPVGRLRAGSNWDWVLRFAVAFAVLAGLPALLGGMFGVVGGSKSGARRR